MNDAISRSAALSMMGEYIDMVGNDDQMHHAMCCVAEGIKALPAFDVVPVVHARWIYSGGMDPDGNSQGHCSMCGAGDRHRADLKNLVPYCWKCGAQMDGETNEC